MAVGENAISEPLIPPYLVEAYERLREHLNGYDESGDSRRLLRALNVACEQLNRFAEDSRFWKAFREIEPTIEFLEQADDFDRQLDYLIEIERNLLTQAGMAPRAVAVLLDHFDIAARAVRSGQDEPSEVLDELQSEVRKLAEVTCREWKDYCGYLQPTAPITASTPEPIMLEEPRRLRRFLQRGVWVLGGGVIIAADSAAVAHGLDPNVGSASVKTGFRLIEVGLIRKAR